MRRTLRLDAGRRLITWDQTRLPFEAVEIELASEQDCTRAIVTMQVRGAPLIGAVGAYALAYAIREDPSDGALSRAVARIVATRPTAVNLRWALDRVSAVVSGLAPAQRENRAWLEAGRICDDDVAANAAIGDHAAAALAGLRKEGAPLQLLTHCNAGGVATVAHGTALAGVYALASVGIPVHVWVDETRPRNQGSGLTAWELRERGIPHTVIVDNAGGLLMQQGRVDAVIVGCDRVAANGDVANKIGTYLKALAAWDNDVPFFVACPVSTIDPWCRSGDAIAIEERSPREVTHVSGRDAAGAIVEVQVCPDRSPVLNPAFDITPARLVSGLITERGRIDASSIGIGGLLKSASAA